MRFKTMSRHDAAGLTLALLATILLPACSQAEEDTSQSPANEPIQVAQAQPGPGTSGGSTGGDKPNILVIWGDDVGYWNVSAYNQGIPGPASPVS